MAARPAAPPASPAGKASGALLTIGEVSRQTGVPQHILRFWETRFPQLRPLQRAGNRRYYRPEDVALVGRIDALLGREGYTVRGVQQLLAAPVPAPPASGPTAPETAASGPPAPALLAGIAAVRDALAAALAADDA